MSLLHAVNISASAMFTFYFPSEPISKGDHENPWSLFFACVSLLHQPNLNKCPKIVSTLKPFPTRMSINPFQLHTGKKKMSVSAQALGFESGKLIKFNASFLCQFPLEVKEITFYKVTLSKIRLHVFSVYDYVRAEEKKMLALFLSLIGNRCLVAAVENFWANFFEMY